MDEAAIREDVFPEDAAGIVNGDGDEAGTDNGDHVGLIVNDSNAEAEHGPGNESSIRVSEATNITTDSSWGSTLPSDRPDTEHSGGADISDANSGPRDESLLNEYIHVMQSRRGAPMDVISVVSYYGL